MSQTSDTTLLTNQYTAAFQLAFEVHAHQLRKGASIPYLAHVMSVSALVMEAGGDEDCAIAGLLHDAVEDSSDGEAMLNRIRGQFGQRVASIVKSCSDWVAVPGAPKAPWRERKEKYIQDLQSADPDALLVSACDKLHNARAIASDMRDLGVAVFDRFSTKNGAEQLWYYQDLCDAFASRVNPAVTLELREAVVDMTRRGIELGIARPEQSEWLIAQAEPRGSLPLPWELGGAH